MAKDRVQPLKLEDPSTGGVETDWGPTSADPNEDYVDTHGLTIQSDISDDEDVFIGRDVSDDMIFQDKVAGGPYTLTDLLAGDETLHKKFRHLIHFIESGGPGDGFASGAFREITGGVFPTSIIWWESSAKLKKLLERTITWGTSPKVPTQDQFKIYDTDGVTVLATATDTISHSGPFETSRVRVFS